MPPLRLVVGTTLVVPGLLRVVASTLTLLISGESLTVVIPKMSEEKEISFSRNQMFIGGISVVIAIVYVLSRGSGSLRCETFDIAAYRQAALAATPPNIIECAGAGEGGSQEACHLPTKERFAALGQKGVTLWMTGLSGSGKSTIARALEEELVLRHHKHVQMLDGDNVRTGLNRDLGFSPADRAESVRRVGEMACLFNGGGVITLVTLVSPYRADRDEVRKRHEDQGLKFLEVFMNVPLEEVQDRDPKGLYAKVANGEISGFTGVDAPYEAPLHPDIDLPNHEFSIDQSVKILMEELEEEGVLTGSRR